MTAKHVATRPMPLGSECSADLDTTLFRGVPGELMVPETKITLRGTFVVSGHGDDVIDELAAVIAKHAI